MFTILFTTYFSGQNKTNQIIWSRKSKVTSFIIIPVIFVVCSIIPAKSVLLDILERKFFKCQCCMIPPTKYFDFLSVSHTNVETKNVNHRY